MIYQLLIDATGAIALTLSVSGLVRQDDRTLMRTGAWASAIWALNNLLIGAQAAAALSALSVGRQAGASALQNHRGKLKAWAFGGLVLATILVAAFTWSGNGTAFPVAGSLLATYAMFHLRGARLRWAMVLVNALWMLNAVAYDSWWQIAANGIAGGAAAAGAWRARPIAPLVNVECCCGSAC